MIGENCSPCRCAPRCSVALPVFWWWYHRAPASALQPPCGPAAGYPSGPTVNNTYSIFRTLITPTIWDISRKISKKHCSWFRHSKRTFLRCFQIIMNVYLKTYYDSSGRNWVPILSSCTLSFLNLNTVQRLFWQSRRRTMSSIGEQTLSFGWRSILWRINCLFLCFCQPGLKLLYLYGERAQQALRHNLTF